VQPGPGNGRQIDFKIRVAGPSSISRLKADSAEFDCCVPAGRRRVFDSIDPKLSSAWTEKSITVRAYELGGADDGLTARAATTTFLAAGVVSTTNRSPADQASGRKVVIK
jgi:hypothetical protein